ncbi:MAG: helix-hairpin-helix domain-containing protein [Gammaproteobacteria bacterium]|nr:helix-hairpin-helix domain-containing protein [Gammaproteobacteria bacterium]
MRKPIAYLLPLLACLPLLAQAGPVNINTADAETISRELTGVGLAKAEAIVKYRKKHGPFQRPDDLSLVKGIGEKILDANRGNIRVTAVNGK